MPFKSKRQMRFLFSQKPAVAKKMAKDARKRHEPILKTKSRRKAGKRK
jgi:hypothetical protein